MTLGQWLHVKTGENPADLGTRKGPPVPLNNLWRHGPTWLMKPEEAPEQPDIFNTTEAQREETKSKDIIFVRS